MNTYSVIGKQLGITKQRAKQIYDSAIAKLQQNLTEEELAELIEALRDCPEESNIHESTSEAMFQQSLGQDKLEGFWKEENNV